MRDQDQSHDQRSAIGQQQKGNITYGAMPEQLVKQLNETTAGGNSGEFILISKVRQGETAQVWTTGDPEQTQALFRDVYTQLAYDTQGQKQTQREHA